MSGIEKIDYLAQVKGSITSYVTHAKQPLFTVAAGVATLALKRDEVTPTRLKDAMDDIWTQCVAGFFGSPYNSGLARSQRFHEMRDELQRRGAL